jgi:small subunit ribosomal protein S2
MVVGILAMLVSPAFPKPLTATWPGPAAPGTLPEAHEEHGTETATAETPEAQADDLTRIEGIGPKIQSVLYDAGIATYAALAGKTPDTIRDVLNAASFTAPADPTSWPEQAALAAHGDWESLQSLVDTLKGGRAVS